MNHLNDSCRQRVLTLALAARTPEQLAIATRELDAWIAEHPEDKGGEWAYEQMGLVEEALRELSANPQQNTEAEGQDLVALAMAAQAPAEIEHAKQALDRWLSDIAGETEIEAASKATALRQPIAA